jgi:multiple antibiotic resistance protein
MTISLSMDQILLFQVSLIAMLSPLGIIGPFAALTVIYPRKIQRRMALLVALYCLGLLVMLFWLGEWLLRILGITLEALNASGGLILMLTSLPLVLKGSTARKKVDPDSLHHDEESWRDLLVSPLVFPLTTGAGTMSLVITYAGQMETFGDRLVFNGMILVLCLIIWLIYYFSGPLSRRIGPQGNLVMNRVAGIILLSLAFTLMSRGLRGLLPGLAG